MELAVPGGVGGEGQQGREGRAVGVTRGWPCVQEPLLREGGSSAEK